MTTPQQTEPVQVTHIIDGDTVEVDQWSYRGWLKVRLFGIDAPEMDQPGGWEATLKLQGLLTGDDDIMLETMAFDQYGRAIGLLYWRDYGRMQSINLRMVHSGLAFCSTTAAGGPLWSGWGFTLRSATPNRTYAGCGAGGDNPVRPWVHRRHTHATDWRTQRATSITKRRRVWYPSNRRILRGGCSLAIAAMLACFLAMIALAGSIVVY